MTTTLTPEARELLVRTVTEKPSNRYAMTVAHLADRLEQSRYVLETYQAANLTGEARGQELLIERLEKSLDRLLSCSPETPVLDLDRLPASKRLAVVDAIHEAYPGAYAVPSRIVVAGRSNVFVFGLETGADRFDVVELADRIAGIR